MRRRGMFGSAWCAALGIAFLPVAGGAQQAPAVAPSVAVPGPRTGNPAADGSVQLRGDGTVFDLAYSNATRRRVLDALAARTGADVEWRSEAAAAERISGRHQGTLDEILDQLLAGRNYIASYESAGSISRIRRLVIQGQGQAASAPVAPQEIQPPESGTVDAAADCATAGVTANRNYGEIQLDNGGVLYAGGVVDCSGAYSQAAELLDPVTGTIKPTGKMSIGRASFPMVRLPSGDILVFGGETSSGISEATDRIERYNVATGEWTVEAHLGHGKGGIATCALNDGTILLVGGVDRIADGNPDATRAAETYVPAQKSVRSVPAASNFEHRTAIKTLPLLDGKCLVASEGAGANLEVYDPAAQKFTAVDVPPDVREGLTNLMQLALLPDGSVLIVASRSMTLDLARNTYRPVP